MKIGKHEFDTKHHCYVMGILNVTPDSFSDGGKWKEKDAALKHAELMIREGADILDVGGESTRPGYTKVSDEEEIERVAPVISSLREHFDVAISVDTYKSRVAQAALTAGADMINDIWGLKYDKKMAEVIAQAQAACCLMHNRKEAAYKDFLPDLLSDLQESLLLAKEAGIRPDGICLDPGVGFAKTYGQNLAVIRDLDALQRLGYPVLLGTSRKSVIGLTLDLSADQRLSGTLATTVIGVMKGCSFVRVHDVKENKEVIAMTEAVLGDREEI